MSEPFQPPGSNWSDYEVDLLVGAYFEMWQEDLRGGSPVKMNNYRALSKMTGRSVKSIERKCQNVSAVLERLGLQWLPGLAPLRNFQRSLIAAVEKRVPQIWHLDDLSIGAQSGFSDISVLFQEPPPQIEASIMTSNSEMERLARKFDPALRDLRNRKTGLFGEELVFRSEIARLSAADRPDLASKVKWVSQEDGDGSGYDIRSFEANGVERFYEVKTTSGHKLTPFFLSRNERDFAEETRENFRIFRLFEVGRSPRSFLIAPPLESALILEPSVYRASFG